MAENAEPGSVAETKKVVNPRVEIDTSPPFESVKEAVDRFGGSGPWIPHHLLRLAGAHHDSDDIFDMEKMEEQAEKLERDLTMKEHETLNVLKELEATRRFIEDLKLNLMPEMSSFVTIPDLKLESHSMAVELNQAKLNLNKTSVDLAVIQASVESLNQKLRRDKVLLERRTKMQMQNPKEPLMSSSTETLQMDGRNEKARVPTAFDIPIILSKEMNQASYEAELFKKMTEASRYEVMKAMAEIEQTKNSIKMAEVRLNAAKKMEEAAKAVEAIAVAERKAKMNSSSSEDTSGDAHQHSFDGVTLSFEEYRVLTQKAKQADDLCNTKFIDTNGLQHRTDEAHQLEMPILEKFEETDSRMKTECLPAQQAVTSSKFKFRNSHSGRYGNRMHATAEDNPIPTPSPASRSTTSIGDVLNRKFIMQDDVMVGRHVENQSERQHVSLSQMLRKQSRVVLNPGKPSTEDHVEKQYFFQRKKIGFIQVPIPTKQNKKKSQPPNHRSNS